MERIKRDTNADLMNNVLELVKKCHCYDKAKKIMDYYCAESFNVMELTDCEFDFEANVQFGTNEGIYIDCSIRGHFNENEPSDKPKDLRCGTFKTLGTTLNDMQIMGELAGSLVYFAREYVNNNLDRYMPEKERKTR